MLGGWYMEGAHSKPLNKPQFGGHLASERFLGSIFSFLLQCSPIERQSHGFRKGKHLQVFGHA
jgi:hypothetical protein